MPDGDAPIHVLVADGDPAVLKMLANTLRRHSFTVTEANSGTEAVRLYGPSVSVVLLGVQLPPDDGPATLAGLGEIDPHVRCCFMTGWGSGYTREGLLGLGAAHVFDKPFEGLDELARKLREVATSCL